MEVDAILDNASQQDSDRSIKLYNLLGFLIWPFGFTLDAIRYWEMPWSKNVFWLFCIFFGYTFIIGENQEMDSFYYADHFIQDAHSNITFGELLKSFYSVNAGYNDIAFPLISFYLSKFTDNPQILFAVFGLIFGFFYSRNIWYLMTRSKSNPTLIVSLFILTFALLNPIWNINGFRFYVAAQIFLYGTLPYLLEGNKKNLIWAGLSIFFHFSFISAVSILILFIFLGNRLHIYMGLFLVTSFIKEIDLQFVQSSLSFLPAFFYSDVQNYTNIEYAESISINRQTLNWYVLFSGSAIRWFIYAFILFFYLFRRSVLAIDGDLKRLMCFSLLLYGVSNVLSLIPSGSRFLTVASTFMFSLIILFLSYYPGDRTLNVIKSLTLPLIAFFIIFTLRFGLDFFGWMTLFGNPVAASITSDIDPLIEFIKGGL